MVTTSVVRPAAPSQQPDLREQAEREDVAEQHGHRSAGTNSGVTRQNTMHSLHRSCRFVRSLGMGEWHR